MTVASTGPRREHLVRASRPHRVGLVVRAAQPWQILLVVGLGLIAAYFAFPKGSTTQSIVNNLLGLMFVAAIPIGVRMHRPAARAIWYLFAYGTLLSILADTIQTAQLAEGLGQPFPSVADVVYLSAYPLLFLAVARIDRTDRSYRLSERHLDATLISLGAFTLTWQLLMGEYAHDNTLSLMAKLTLMAYPFMDLALLYIVFSALVFGGKRTPAITLVGLAIVSMLVGDLAYDALVMTGGYTAGDLLDATWLLNYLLLGVAALHPSMATAASQPTRVPPKLWWLGLALTASVIAPVVLLVGSLAHAEMDVPVLASVMALSVLFGSVRMLGLFNSLRGRADQLQSLLAEQSQVQRKMASQAVQLRLTNQRLERSNADLEAFAQAASHDMSEPLRAIALPLASLARHYRGQLDARADEYIDYAVNASERLQHLIDQMRTYATAGLRDEPPEFVDCNVVMHEVVASLQPAICEVKATVHVDPLPTVFGDPQALRQVFGHLLMNALTFVPPGTSPVVHVSATATPTENRITIVDNGIGVEPQYREQIFGIFKRLHPIDQYPGTGVGLAIVKKMVEAQGGQVGVDDNPDGPGSAFWVALPRVDVPALVSTG